MKPDEAALIRKNVAKLYQHSKVAFAAALSLLLQELYDHPDQINPDKCVDTAWANTGLDDTFHDLGSLGYKILIREDWNPLKPQDDADWTPSPDCIDNPTTRGGLDIE